MNESLELAARLRRHLGPDAMMLWQGKGRSILLSGHIGLSHDDIATQEAAAITIEVPQQWKQVPPLVRSFEPWIKRSIEWHTFTRIDGVLCYVFDGHWQHHLQNLSRRELDEPIAQIASDWCLNSVSWLLYRHLYAYETGQSEWNPLWGGWPHSPKAAWAEFESLKTKHQI